MNKRIDMTIRPGARGAFTIIELLVAITIIVLLASVSVAGISYAKRKAMKASATNQLSGLQTALATYYNDFKMYPPSATPAYGGTIALGRGGAMLAEALVGYLNGDADGAGIFSGSNGVYSDASNFGFRMTKNYAMGGKIYGPYASLEPKVYKALSATDQYFIDPWGKEIIYFRSTQSVPNPTTVPTQIFGTAANAVFVSADCSKDPTYAAYNPIADPASAGTAFFQLLRAPDPQTNTSTVTPLGSDSYLLISPGPDGIYFNADDVIVGKN